MIVVTKDTAFEPGPGVILRMRGYYESTATLEAHTPAGGYVAIFTGTPDECQKHFDRIVYAWAQGTDATLLVAGESEESRDGDKAAS